VRPVRISSCTVIVTALIADVLLIAHFFCPMHYLFISFFSCASFLSFFAIFFPLGFVVAMLSIHTVDHWVVFDTIYMHSGTPI